MVGGGWAGLAAAVRATQLGHATTVFEASRQWGGRARNLATTDSNGQSLVLDNGQHILIGAYTETLRLMRCVGVDPERVLLRQPLSLTCADGTGLKLPGGALARALPSVLQVLIGIAGAKGWSWRDKQSLLSTAVRWRLAGFECTPTTSVADLCARLTPKVQQEFTEPLCVSALNTPAHQASGAVFLRVLKDALFSGRGGADLLLPRVPLGDLFPLPAVAWLQQAGHPTDLRLGCRVLSLEAAAGQADGTCWRVNGELFDHVVWATSPSKSALSIVQKALSAHFFDSSGPKHLQSPGVVSDWIERNHQLRFEAIATVYAHLSQPDPHGQASRQAMTALRPGPGLPAQFVFDRGQLGGPAGLLAWVVSASGNDVASLETQVVAQAQQQLGWSITPLKTVVEKKATFACTPGLLRPNRWIAPGLTAAGDHIAGPYPATLEGAIRSGWAAADLGSAPHT